MSLVQKEKGLKLKPHCVLISFINFPQTLVQKYCILKEKNMLEVFSLEKAPVIYQGNEYILIYQYSSGYCEIKKEGEHNHQIILVHFSELQLKVS